jgi:hypothetical protein
VEEEPNTTLRLHVKDGVVGFSLVDVLTGSLSESQRTAPVVRTIDQAVLQEDGMQVGQRMLRLRKADALDGTGPGAWYAVGNERSEAIMGMIKVLGSDIDLELSVEPVVADPEAQGVRSKRRSLQHASIHLLSTDLPPVSDLHDDHGHHLHLGKFGRFISSRIHRNQPRDGPDPRMAASAAAASPQEAALGSSSGSVEAHAPHKLFGLFHHHQGPRPDRGRGKRAERRRAGSSSSAASAAETGEARGSSTQITDI